METRQQLVDKIKSFENYLLGKDSVNQIFKTGVYAPLERLSMTQLKQLAKDYKIK